MNKNRIKKISKKSGRNLEENMDVEGSRINYGRSFLFSPVKEDEPRKTD